MPCMRTVGMRPAARASGAISRVASVLQQAPCDAVATHSPVATCVRWRVFSPVCLARSALLRWLTGVFCWGCLVWGCRDLNGNSLSGPIPSELGKLVQLTHL